MESVKFRLPDKIRAKLDELVEEGFYPTRSEALRNAVITLLRKHRKV